MNWSLLCILFHPQDMGTPLRAVLVVKILKLDDFIVLSLAIFWHDKPGNDQFNQKAAVELLVEVIESNKAKFRMVSTGEADAKEIQNYILSLKDFNYDYPIVYPWWNREWSSDLSEGDLKELMYKVLNFLWHHRMGHQQSIFKKWFQEIMQKMLESD